MNKKLNLLALTLALLASAALAQTSAFNFTGQLSDGGLPATGNYDFNFRLYNAPSNGVEVAGVIAAPLTPVKNGVFSCLLNYGADAFTNGANLWVQAEVRPAGSSGGYTALGRQQLTPVPFALFALRGNQGPAGRDGTSGRDGTNGPAGPPGPAGTVDPSSLTNYAQLNVTDTSMQAGATANVAGGYIIGVSVTNQGNGYVTNPIVTITDSTGSGAVLTPIVVGYKVVGISVPNPGSNYSASPTVNISAPPRFARQTSTSDNVFNGSTVFNGPVSGVFSGSGAGLTNVPGNFVWQTVTGSSTQGAPNHGYRLAGESGRPTLVLPPTAELHDNDIVKVLGTGTNGWGIATNAGQMIVSPAISWLWKEVGTTQSWRSVASSADGTTLAAAVSGGLIYVSTDSGNTWINRATSQNWRAIASSADGTKLAAAVYGGQIYLSGDSGATWSPTASGENWSSIASSADGTHLVAVVNGGTAYTSWNAGGSWIARTTGGTGPLPWVSVASSADGTKLVAVSGDSTICTSTNSGASWVVRYWNWNQSWTSVASSADGTKLAAAMQNGQIYISTNSGAGWQPCASVQNWTSISCSADGTTLVATAGSGQIYVSTDTGQSWAAREKERNWSSVAASVDGSKFLAANSTGQLYLFDGAQPVFITGGQYSSITLQYIGTGTFVVVEFFAGDLAGRQ